MFRRVHTHAINSPVAVLLVGVCFCASALAGTFQRAPMNPEFQAGKAAIGENYGYIPAPVDWSHPKRKSGLAFPI